MLEKSQTVAQLKNKGKNWSQVLCICITSLGSFTTGIIAGWSSPYAISIVKDKENYNINEDEASYFIIVHPLGIVASSLLYFKISEYLGRKKSVLVLAIPHILCWLVTIFAQNKWEFYVARFLGGIGDTILFCSVPAYIGEISVPDVRGTWGNFPTFMLNLGILFITILGSYVDVKLACYICIAIPTLYTILVIFVLPESPYQLIKDGKFDEAIKSIQWLRRKDNVDDEFASMKSDVERQLSENGHWKELVTVLSNWRALRAGLFMRFGQTMSGITVFNSYTQTIFDKAGGNINPQYSSMIFIGMLCFMLLCATPIPEKLGRKQAYLLSVIACGVILLLLSSYFAIEHFGFADLHQYKWFPLVGMVTYIVGFSIGLGIVPSLMLGELFSSSIKSKGLCVLLFAMGLSNTISTIIFKVMVNSIGFYSPFILYGVFCFLTSMVTLKWVPETKGKTLEQIQQELKK